MVGLFRKRQSSSSATATSSTSVTIDEIIPHLRSTVYITGAFCCAWAWDLVFYGASHAWAGENPLRDQLGFGNQRAPKHILVLLLQYLVVCGGAAVLSDWFRKNNKNWSQAAITAIEFFPSPVFAGKLMAYLTQFSRLGTVKRAVINLAATWFAASLAHVMPLLIVSENNGLFIERLGLTRFGEIVQNTLGFGLGIAWNVLLGQFAPDERSDWDIIHIVALGGYLACVTLVSFRLAAMVKDNGDDSSDDEMTIWDRQLALLCFAFYVVCAFTLVTFLNALLHPGWIGALESLGILLVLSASMSAMVLRVDFDSTIEHYQNDQKPFDLGPCGVVLFLLPCVWCCCPWLPLLWVLAGTTETLHVKEHWFQLIAMVAGLAASIDASSMLTLTTNAIAGSLGICNIKHCRHSWLFVLMQVVLAIATTAVLIPLIAPLAPSGHSNEQTRNQDDGEATTERQPLLRRIRNKLSRSGQCTRQENVEAGGRSGTA